MKPYAIYVSDCGAPVGFRRALARPERLTAIISQNGNASGKGLSTDLFLDYASNVPLYPKFHEYFAAKRPLLLAVWGKNDPFFLPADAEAFRRDNPNAEVHFYGTGHFAIETHTGEIAAVINEFLLHRSPR